MYFVSFYAKRRAFGPIWSQRLEEPFVVPTTVLAKMKKFYVVDELDKIK